MKLSTIYLFTFLMLFATVSIKTNLLHAQASNSNSKTESLMLKKAEIAYDNMKFSVAANYFENYLKQTDSSSKLILSKLADCYWQMREFKEALRVYNIIYINGKQGVNQKEQIRIAELFARFGDYKKASEWLYDVHGYQQKSSAYREMSLLNSLKKDSSNWRVNLLNVNSSYREFSPFLKDSILYFSSNKPLLNKTKSFGWDGNNFARLWEISVSKIDSVFNSLKNENKLLKSQSSDSQAKLAGFYEYGDSKLQSSSFNKLIKANYIQNDSVQIGNLIKGFEKVQNNAGAIAIDKNKHFYFSANYPKAAKDGINRICLMEGLISSANVSEIKQLPFGDANSYSVMHPAVNPEGTLLVFSSDKPNGVGAMDLYFSQRNNADLPWETFKPFSSKINTIGNEVFPTITSNGYLYYSSDVTPGLGGLDIFRIPLQDALAGIGGPEHISYPINSSSDDFGWTQDTSSTKGYFTSDRLNDNDNIYSFNYIPTKIIKTPKKSFYEGYVVDKESKRAIKGAIVFLYEKGADSVFVAQTDDYGKYHLPILATNDVIVKSIDNKYLSDCFTAKVVYEPQPVDTIQKALRNLQLDKFKLGFVWKVSDIHYDFNKADIRPDAMPILDSIVMILEAHQITVELGSHTDSRGSASYNERLSQHRADSAVEYIVSKGIDRSRITAKGYGERQLLNKCADKVPCSEEEHQANRRTEVKVTGYTTPQVVKAEIDANKFLNVEKVSLTELPADFFDECK